MSHSNSGGAAGAVRSVESSSTTDGMTDRSTPSRTEDDGRFANLSKVPRELVLMPQWVVWKAALRNGKPTKLPVNPMTGRLAAIDNSTSWADYESAVEAVGRFKGEGVGFVFTDSDPYTGIDLDDCRDPQTGEIQPWARDIVQALHSYTEISPSQQGVKIWVRGKLAAGKRNRTALEAGEVEIYSRDRYFTVTGQQLPGTPDTIEERQAALTSLHARIFASKRNSKKPPAPVGSAVGVDDAELLEHARSAKNGGKFADLWNGDHSGYSSQSEADLALCSMLAFWTGKNRVRMDLLFRQSGLMREKWEREDYRERTITAACDMMNEVWRPHTAANGFAKTAVSGTSQGGVTAPSVSTATQDQPRYPGQPYVIHNGHLYGFKLLRENYVPFKIANFDARIVADLVTDDGAEQTRVFTIEAELGTRKTRMDISAKDFRAMNWVPEKLGGMAIVYPGLTEYARTAVQFLSGEIPTRHTFSHTGWRTIDGQEYYLHGGGAIGPEGNRPDVCVSLQDKLPNYQLPSPPRNADCVAAIRASLQMLEVTLDRLTFPVYAAIWRSILGSATFSVHIAGSSGAGKSQLAALAQQHFGPAMDADNLPASWLATANATALLAFYAKDTLLTVDDFVPVGNAASQQKLHSEADRLLRSQGNSAGRRRLTSDGRLLANRPPRGLILSTGEDTPKGKSLSARLLLLRFPKGAMDWEKLTQCQRLAARGDFAVAAASFIKWLSPQILEIQRSMKERRLFHRKGLNLEGIQHPRTPENLDALWFGLTTFLDFAQSIGAISGGERDSLVNRAEIAFQETVVGEAQKHAEHEPARIFLRLVRSAVSMGKAHLASRDGGAPEGARPWGWYIPAGAREKQSRGDRIGWVQGDDIFLLPDAAHAVACRLAHEQGESLPGSVETIKRDLKEQGILARTDTKRRTITMRRTIEGEAQDVLFLTYESFQQATMGSTVNADNADIADDDGGGEVATG
jgi:hypothetical protein